MNVLAVILGVLLGVVGAIAYVAKRIFTDYDIS